jgi:hypothetical protein
MILVPRTSTTPLKTNPNLVMTCCATCHPLKQTFGLRNAQHPESSERIKKSLQAVAASKRPTILGKPVRELAWYVLCW